MAVVMIVVIPLVAIGGPDLPDEYPGYETRRVEGWRVLVSEELKSEDAVAAARVVAALGEKLEEIGRLVPPQRLAFLRTVPIWVEYKNEEFEAVVYHPSDEWLFRKGANADKAECVEIASAGAFLKKLRRQPMILLHELAHAYHHKELGWEEESILRAYREAKKAGLYKAVKRTNDELVRAYALANAKEYFCELTEAYFGRNDYFPHTRKDLKTYDPAGFEAVNRVWNKSEPAAPGRISRR